MTMVTLEEYSDISEALIDWFKSQEIPPATAVTTMCIVVGALCAYQSNTEEETLQHCDLTATAIRSVARAGIARKKNRQIR